MSQVLNTPFIPVQAADPFSYCDQLMLIGSCFAEAIGQKLRKDQFRTSTNPFGIVYNPHTMALQLELLIEGDLDRLPTLYFDGDLFHSPLHHGAFSGPEHEEVLAGIRKQFREAREALTRARLLILTWGHTDVFYEKNSGLPVANCHKRPADHFELRVASLHDLISVWESSLQKLRAFNPDLVILLTVSPVRYLRRGLGANSRSKATLHLLVQHLEGFGAHYFPAYEILTDELRDYRFYAEDLVHPSSLAVDMIYERFLESWHTPAESDLLHKIRDLHRMLSHRSIHPGSPADVKFQEKQLEQLQDFRKAYPDYPWMFAG